MLGTPFMVDRACAAQSAVLLLHDRREMRWSYTVHHMAAERGIITYRSHFFRPGRRRADSTCIFDVSFKTQDGTIEAINLRPCNVEIGLGKVLLYGAANAL
jgi:hypothetical protein